jgi:hypothetical protein
MERHTGCITYTPKSFWSIIAFNLHISKRQYNGPLCLDEPFLAMDLFFRMHRPAG